MQGKCMALGGTPALLPLCCGLRRRFAAIAAACTTVDLRPPLLPVARLAAHCSLRRAAAAPHRVETLRCRALAAARRCRCRPLPACQFGCRRHSCLSSYPLYPATVGPRGGQANVSTEHGHEASACDTRWREGGAAAHRGTNWMSLTILEKNRDTCQQICVGKESVALLPLANRCCWHICCKSSPGRALPKSRVTPC